MNATKIMVEWGIIYELGLTAEVEMKFWDGANVLSKDSTNATAVGFIDAKYQEEVDRIKAENIARWESVK